MALETFVLMSSILALVVASLFALWVSKRSRGSQEMREFSDAIHNGAMTFLGQEYKYLSIFMVIMAIVLLSLYSWTEGPWYGLEMVSCFLFGAILSALTGNIGMRIATVANSRSTQACRKDIGSGLNVALRAGAVMGLCVVGLGLLGISIIYYGLDLDPQGEINVLFGYGFGASSIALFARVGGGIYTKGADVGADIVGKVEEGIPEDDPRNPGVIADNVGDNVGDVAGMGADLFESYVEAIISTMIIGAALIVRETALPVVNEKFVTFPLLIAGLGIFSSIVGILLVRGKKPAMAMNIGTFISAGLVAVLSFVASLSVFDDLGPFLAVLSGLVAGLIIGLTSQYFTSYDYRPVKSLAKDAQTGPATVIISGMSLGMMSTVIPIIVTAVAMIGAYLATKGLATGGEEVSIAGVYGIALASLGMLSTLGMTLSTDCYGPVADNAAGIAEMAHVGGEVRERAENLDALGNTTAAIGKGFAIGSAALAALALIFSYVIVAGIPLESIYITDPKIVAGIFIGALIPFLFGSLALRGVGSAAFKLVEEIRRQFREIEGLRKGEAKPDYNRAIEISTTGAIRSMLLPGVIAVVAPIAVGLALGPKALAGFLVGSLATGFLLAIYMANAGGAWDNAKKYIETGKFGGKGGETHAASVIGDTVGDPLKDTSGPSLNILIKLMSVVAIIFAPFL
jgi:K(+)-stimulated pyrophosphate-energized sodium pump